MFEAFAVGNENRFGARRRARETRTVQSPHEWTRHDKAFGGKPEVVEKTRGPIEDAVADRHHIRARRGAHIDPDDVGHGARLGYIHKGHKGRNPKPTKDTKGTRDIKVKTRYNISFVSSVFFVSSVVDRRRK